MRQAIDRLWQGLDADHRALAGQILRYGLVGGGVTAFQIIVYNLLVGPAGIAPLAANPLATAAAMVVGYFIHSSFTFAGHEGGGVAQTGWRYAIVTAIGFALNQSWVWLFTRHLGWPNWSPSLAFLFATPPVLFLLNRKWVFD